MGWLWGEAVDEVIAGGSSEQERSSLMLLCLPRVRVYKGAGLLLAAA